MIFGLVDCRMIQKLLYLIDEGLHREERAAGIQGEVPRGIGARQEDP